MSRALTLIALYISNLLVLFYFLTLFATNVRFAGSQELYSYPDQRRQQLSENLGGLINGLNSSGSSSSGVEIDNNGQQFGENGGNDGASSTQSSQSLQLILTKLFPTLKHWSKNSQFEDTPPQPVLNDADQTSFITTGQIGGDANELQQDQSSTIQPTDLNYVIAANHNNNNPNHFYHQRQQQQQQMIQQNLNENSTNANANSPIRQLISAHSNALFYPPTEQPYQTQHHHQHRQQQQQLQQIQQLPLLVPQHNNNNNLANAHYSDHLTLQTQQSFLPNHLQSVESTKPSLYHYTPTLPQPSSSSPSHHFSLAPQTQNFPSTPPRPTTTTTTATTANFIAPHTNLLQLASLPISSNSNVQQPYYSSFKPFSLEQLQHQQLQQQQQQQQQTPEPSQPQNGSHLSSMLAFLANNRANLSNLIQLLPLIAQTISILPKVFPISKGSFSATPTSMAELSSPKNYHHESSLPSKSSQPSSSSILSLIQSSTSSSKNSNATENLTERFQHSTTTTDSSNQSLANTSNDNQVSSSLINSSNNRLQSLLSNPILTQILPHLAKQFVSTSLNQYSSQQPLSQYEFPGVNKPDISYTFADSAASSPSTSNSITQPTNSLNWIKGFVASLAASAQKQQEQQRLFDRNKWQNSDPQSNPPPGLGFNLDSIPSTNTLSTTTGWLNNIRPVSQVLESWLLNRINGKL